MISRIKKLWNGLCDILEGPWEYSAPDLNVPDIDPLSHVQELAEEAQKVITFDPEETDYSYGGPWDDWPQERIKMKTTEGSVYFAYKRNWGSRARNPGFSSTLDIF